MTIAMTTLQISLKNYGKAEKFLVGFGGEHGVTYPILKSLTETGKKVGIIHLDAHYDNMPDYEAVSLCP